MKHFEEKVLQGTGICQHTAQKFKAGINQWEGPIPPTTDVVSWLTFEAFVNQKGIGWGQVFQGRIRKNWNMAIVAFNKTKDMGETTAMSNWSVQVISGLWQVGIESWINRNKVLH